MAFRYVDAKYSVPNVNNSFQNEQFFETYQKPKFKIHITGKLQKWTV